MTARTTFLSIFLVSMFPLIVTAQSSAEKAESIRLKLRAVDESISAPEYVGRNIDADLAAIRNLTKYREHLKEIAAEFSKQIQTGVQPFANLGYTLQGLAQHIDQFEVSARDFGSPAMIRADLDHILKMAKQAVEFQAPAYFRPENDIGIRTEKVKTRLRYLEALALDSAELKAAQEQLVATTKQVSEIQKSLSAMILSQNNLPQDGYQRADRETLLKLIRDKWVQTGSKSQVLKVGLVSEDWTRSSAWEIQNRTLYKVDRSRIQGYIVVALNDKIAVRHSLNLVKDHVDGDKVSLSFLNDPRAAPEITDQILRSKIK